MDKELVDCPDCEGTGTVWGDYEGMEIEAECPYCGGGGKAFRRMVEKRRESRY